MKPSIRQKILETSKKLFNEKGFNNVSIQEIASALGISKGNLTYYFRKKEEIIEAIVKECPRCDNPKAPDNLEDLDQYFHFMHNVIQENAFYFWHYAQMLQLSTTLKDEQRKVYEIHRKTLSLSFHLLFEAGLIRDEAFPKEYERLIDALYQSIIYWLPFCELRKEQNVSFQTHAWSIMHNILTKQGRERLENFTEYSHW
ncbi:TetR/AcrR family transcriptional regulator [Sporosalibacterium faouarense]|uniref:TetR/AcrR family transcriptional regulator n=1 Tax=Sporosalibacterium faouarense TaxID=516123 RepID=UPI00141D11A9|nr:TetR/AcrR family transcriptional regulator [Sporosalibacterium faouarense]MTI47272.1 TetR/AcrR family transcriptional regulator [Bacillota bacterium]